ncbi:MAG: HAMP domain-containing protein [Planctomycetota bacterium]|jgi:methyl-accepting chemotaxis protein
MLRRKLLLVLGSLILVLVLAAVFAIGLLHNVLEDLVSATTAALTGTAQCAELEGAMRAIEADLSELRRQGGGALDDIAEDLAFLRLHADNMEAGTVSLAAGATLQPIREHLEALAHQVEQFGSSDDPAGRAEHLERAIDSAAALGAQVSELTGLVRSHGVGEQERLIRKFRVAGLLLGVVFLVLLNVSIIAVLRAATMVLRPVDELVEASRRLAREQFGHRIEKVRNDEFGELARAYNSLAEQLASNEQRKLETLHQVARTLNHELNNAISAIDLQLELLGRRSSGDRSLVEPLQRIQQTLGRMSHTIDSLQRVRKIVLTDYLAGIKMLDLERSVTEGIPASPAAPAATES